VYSKLERLRAPAAMTVPPDETAKAPSAETGAGPPAEPAASASWTARIVSAVQLTVASIGWPILVLAIVGAWHLWITRTADRIGLVLAGWGIAALGFLIVGIATPVDPQFQRYALEFVSRVVLAIYPALVILAARGAAWAWRAGAAPRIASAALMASAVVVGVRYWAGWIA
jgi:hypothetical protein